MADFDVIGVEYKGDFSNYEQALKEAIAANVKLGQSAEKTSEQIQQGINETTAATAKLKAETQNLTQTREEQAKKIHKLIQEEKQDLQELKREMKQAVNPKDIKEYNDRIRETEKRIQSLTQKSKELSGGTKTLIGQLRQMRNTLALMKETDPGYAKLFIEAAKLEDKINDVRQAVHAMSSDTVVFDTLAQGAQTLSGAFAAVEGATALFGSESEDLQKALLRVNAAMSVAYGIQQVTQNLNEKTILGQKLRIFWTNVEAVVIGKATGAMKAFRIALALTGVGALIIGIATLAANWDKVKDALSGVNPETKKFEELTIKAGEASRDAADNFDEEARRLRVLGYEEKEIIKIRQLGLDQAFDKTQQEIMLEQNKLDELKAINGKSMVAGMGVILGLKHNKDEEIKIAEERITKLKELAVKYDTDFRELTLEISDLDKKEAEKRAEDQKKFNAEKLTEEREFQQLVIDVMKDGVEKQLMQEQFNYEVQREKFKENKDALQILEKDHLRKMEEIRANAENERRNKEFNAGIELFNVQRDENQKKEDALNEELRREQEFQAGILAFQQQGAVERKKSRDEEIADIQAYGQAIGSMGESTYSSLTALSNAFIKDEEKRAKFQKALTLFYLASKSGEAVASAIASASGLPFPANIAAIAGSVAVVLGNVATAYSLFHKADAPEGFAKGVIDLQGPGTGTSDSIPARLSKGESIITANRTKAYKDELNAIQRGDLQELITNKYVLPQLKAVHEARTTGERMAASMAFNFDDSEINHNLRKGRSAISKDLDRLGNRIEKTLSENSYGANKKWKA